MRAARRHWAGRKAHLVTVAIGGSRDRRRTCRPAAGRRAWSSTGWTTRDSGTSSTRVFAVVEPDRRVGLARQIPVAAAEDHQRVHRRDRSRQRRLRVQHRAGRDHPGARHPAGHWRHGGAVQEPADDELPHRAGSRQDGPAARAHRGDRGCAGRRPAVPPDRATARRPGPGHRDRAEGRGGLRRNLGHRPGGRRCGPPRAS